MIQKRFFFDYVSKVIRYTGFLLILFSFSAPAQTAGKAAEIDTYIKPLAKANQFSGVILAFYNGKVIYEKSFGMAQAEHDVPNRINTVFSIASVTKPMTQTIAIRLSEEGKLNLQDKLSKWIPDFPDGDRITIDMLIQHSSGIPHRATTEEEESLRYTAEDMVEKARHVKLIFKPGERSAYSSLGYSVLARVLELAAGKSYSRILKEYVFTPAGMKDSVDYNGEMILPHRAQEYFLEPAGIVHAPLKDYSFLVGAGSVFSTAHDIFNFGEAVINGRYGAAVKNNLLTDQVFSANGVTGAFRCFVTLDSRKDFGFVVLSNLSSGANDLLVRDLQNILQNRPVSSPPEIPGFIINPIPVERLKEYVGVYTFPNFTNRITIKNDQLISGNYKIFPLGNDRFFRFADYATLTFIRNSDGVIKDMEWKGTDIKTTGTKQP